MITERIIRSRRFRETISALAYSLSREHRSPGDATFDAPFNDVTAFVLGQVMRTTGWLRLPLVFATIFFDLCGWRRGGPFRTATPARRDAQISAWRASRVRAFRDLVRFYENLVVLSLYERPARIELARDISSMNDQSSIDDRFSAAPPDEARCDVLVIGSGPGGAVTAAIIAEAGRDVIVLEEGDHRSQVACPPYSSEEIASRWRNGGITAAVGRGTRVAYVEGRCVGGGSEINSGLYHRTPPEILERWRTDFQVEALGEKDLLPHFEACERDLRVSTIPGGRAPAPSQKMLAGATRLGWKAVEVPRWYAYDGSIDAAGEPRGVRQSMTQTFLPRAMKAGARVFAGARVARLESDGSGWVALGRTRAGREFRVRAEHVFVACGAIQTPALLQRSGIAGNVGRSLALHPSVKVVAEFEDVVNSRDLGVPVHQVKEFSPALSFGCSLSRPPLLALGLLDHPDHRERVHRRWPHMAAYYAMIDGHAHGSVRAIPGFVDPMVRYALSENDRRRLAGGLRKLSDLLFAAGAIALFPSISGSGAVLARDELSRIPNVLAPLDNVMTVHVFASCPMGEDRRRAAVDSFGRVHGAKNLHVADASLLCGAPSVNPQGTIMALARRNALAFLGR